MSVTDKPPPSLLTADVFYGQLQYLCFLGKEILKSALIEHENNIFLNVKQSILINFLFKQLPILSLTNNSIFC